jgi:hypothetical protein
VWRYLYNVSTNLKEAREGVSESNMNTSIVKPTGFPWTSRVRSQGGLSVEEQYYNRCRLHSAFGYRSPDGFEKEAGESKLGGSLCSSYNDVLWHTFASTGARSAGDRQNLATALS